MHELLHVQLGPRANHLGTHAWNIAESHFAYSDTDTDYDIDHGVDWREGLGKEGEETYTPRLILVDVKENFGALPNINALYKTLAEYENPEDILAPSPVQTSPPIAPSPYQTFLSSNHADPTEDEDAPGPPVVETTRYWSDYNRVYYHPRSMNPLPAVFRRVKDEVGLGQGMGSWGEGEEGWRGLEGLDTTPLDNFRLFAEEADLLQGVQMSADISTGFAAIANEMMGGYKDEYPKGEAVVVGLMGGLPGTGVGPGEVEGDRERAVREMSRTFCEAQAIKTLLDHDATFLPIQAPEETWLSPIEADPASPSFDKTNPYSRIDPNNLHLTSALLATHLTSALLPLRLKTGRISLPTLVQKLNWRGDTRIIGLSGRAPVWDVNASATAMGKAVVEGWDFSTMRGKASEKYTPFFAHSVIRGVRTPDLPGALASIEANSGGLKGHLLSSQSLPPPFPLASPFPPIFSFPPTPTSSLVPSQTNPPPPTPSHPTAIPVISTLSTTTQPRHLLSSHAAAIDTFLRRHGDLRKCGMGDGFGRDEGRELVEALWGRGEGVGEGEEEAEERDGEE